MTDLEQLLTCKKEEADYKTDAILGKGMSWGGFHWAADIEHFSDYRDVCQQIMMGMMPILLIHGIESDAYVTLDSSNVQSFFDAGKAFKINTASDGYKIKDLGGLLSDGVTTVKALKDMTLEELQAWQDPRQYN